MGNKVFLLVEEFDVVDFVLRVTSLDESDLIFCREIQNFMFAEHWSPLILNDWRWMCFIS